MTEALASMYLNFSCRLAKGMCDIDVTAHLSAVESEFVVCTLALLLLISMSVTLEQTQQSNRMPAPILINSNYPSTSPRNYPLTLSTPSSQRHHVSSSPSSTISSGSQASLRALDNKINHHHSSNPQARKVQVKFAPLPDPRKLEENEVESPTSTSDSDDLAYDEVRKGSLIGNISGFRSSKVSLENDQNNGLIDGQQPSNKPKSSPRWSTKRLLRPLLPKSATPNALSSSENTGSLYRPSSMDSIRSTQSAAAYSSEIPVEGASPSSRGLGNNQRSASDLEQRRTRSANNNSSGPLSWMSPLTLTTSESGLSSAKRILSGSTASSSSIGYDVRRTHSNTSDVAAGAPKKRFMLNGRVYGTRRGGLTPDPNSLQRTVEPEFVEWGQMGLGSVRHVPSSTASAPTTTTLAGKTPAAVGKSTDEYQNDDGGGMAWVRKRKAQREQRAQAEADAKKIAAAASAPSPEKEDGDEGSDAAPSSSSATSASSNSVVDSDDSPSVEEGYTPGSTGSRTSEEEEGGDYVVYDDEHPSIATPRGRDSDVSSIPTIVIEHFADDGADTDETESRSQTPIASSSPSVNASSATLPHPSAPGGVNGTFSRTPSSTSATRQEHKTVMASVPPPVRHHSHSAHAHHNHHHASPHEHEAASEVRGRTSTSSVSSKKLEVNSPESSSSEESDEDEEGDDEGDEDEDADDDEAQEDEDEEVSFSFSPTISLRILRWSPTI